MISPSDQQGMYDFVDLGGFEMIDGDDNIVTTRGTFISSRPQGGSP